ncbi:hypothetical protein DPMN_099454, partial [Dreissena polymorpha]
ETGEGYQRITVPQCVQETAKGYQRIMVPQHVQETAEGYQRITVPQRMMERLHRHNLRIEKEKALKKRQNLSSLMITTKRREFQFYRGQKFDVFDPKQLASHGWKHRQCGDDHFTILCHAPNPAVVADDGIFSFKDMELHEKLQLFLASQKLDSPTEIQKLVIPVLRGGQHVICAAETGSGKTFAYMLPMVHNILQQRDSGIYQRDITGSPACIVLVPTHDLASQLRDVCVKMADFTELKPFICTDVRKMIYLKDTGHDILISTPALVKRFIKHKAVNLSRVISVVVDEADTLMDDSFSADTLSVLRSLQVGGSAPTDDVQVNEGVQVVLVSATFPRGLDGTLGNILPLHSVSQLTTKALHRLMPHVPQKFMKMKPKDKLPTIVEMLKSKPDVTFMVFCNTTRSCFWLSQTLAEVGVDNSCVSGDMTAEDRQKALKAFSSRKSKVIVCTDILSRGMDIQNVDHVVNFDFPCHMSDYIHRAGRVGRVGAVQTGQVTSFISRPHEVDLVWKIEVAARQKTELQNVNANIKQSYPHRPPKQTARTE